MIGTQSQKSEPVTLNLGPNHQVEVRAFSDRRHAPFSELGRLLSDKDYRGQHVALHFKSPITGMTQVVFVSISPSGEVRETYGERRRVSLPTPFVST